MVSISALKSSGDWSRWLPQGNVLYSFLSLTWQETACCSIISLCFCFNHSFFFSAIVPPSKACAQYKLYASYSCQPQALWLNNRMLPFCLGLSTSTPDSSFRRQCPQEGVMLSNGRQMWAGMPNHLEECRRSLTKTRADTRRSEHSMLHPHMFSNMCTCRPNFPSMARDHK